MASFLSGNPGSTTGPSGPVHSVTLGEYLIFNSPVTTEKEISELLIELHEKWIPLRGSKKFIDREIITGRYFDELLYKKLTPFRLYKKMKKEHADALCSRGELGLGPVSYYKDIENKRINDTQEGFFIVFADGKQYSVAAAAGSGHHVLVYCTTKSRDADFEGYDACVEITNIDAFVDAVARSIQAHFQSTNVLKRVEHGSCVYQHSRVIRGPMPGFNEALVVARELSVNTIDFLTDRQYLIKERHYIGDREYRMSFIMRTDVTSYTIINCPEIIPMCRRIK